MKSALIPALALLWIAIPASASVEQRTYSASAYELGGDQLLYVEKHVETWRNGRLEEREVRYENPEGGLIAEKTVRYGETLAAPSFEMEDYRIGLREGATVNSNDVLLYSTDAGETPRPSRVERPETAVVDAGFDAFMRENFDAIVAGEKVEFDFAVPASGRFFRFQLVPEGEIRHRGAPAFQVKMRPASMFLRLLVDPIELVYSSDGLLLEFRGLANVCDRDGERYKARIAFDYPETTASATAPAPAVGSAR